MRVLAILLGLAVLTALAGIGVRTWAPGFDAQALRAIAGGRNATLTSVAWVVTEAGSFVLLAPLSIAFLLLRRWKRPADDIALVVIAAGSALLPFVVKLFVARPRPTVEHLSHLSSLSFPSEHTTQAAAIYLTIAMLGWSWALLVFHWARPKLIQDQPALGRPAAG
ncbi:MAG: hypothetical protein E6I43_10405 [Chloroflexi bacterium]|nr:MAG: hypothetical protein E6I43_10405 [Chloroflexota bacterium]